MTGLEIAVIGMASRFPGAKNIDEFWNNLKNGIESISFFLDKELIDANVDSELIKHPKYVKANVPLEDIEYFDSSFFGYTPKEVEIMDPQNRIFHECVWNALEDAGYIPDSYKGLIGLYAGATTSFNWKAHSFLAGKGSDIGNFASEYLSDRDFMTLQISYKLNLKGPSFPVYTACSTSLVAIHLACQSLLNGECDISLAGGVTINLDRYKGYWHQDGMIMSSDGHCRAFDVKADGTVGGNGVGVVVLKRLEDALADGDNIYAVVKGSAVNNDGIRKVGFTAPSIEGQAEVIKVAQHISGVTPESISYIEAHGTGTTLGDPIEIEALKLAFNTNRRKYCAIGSVKTNLGHLDSAAGVAGFIKTVLALKYKLIPPSLHFENPNPKIDFHNSPFYVNTRPKKWINDSYPLRAGVSSFGIGGTNVHVILEESPKEGNPPVEEDSEVEKIFLLSANSEYSIKRKVRDLKEFLEKNITCHLSDVAFTLQVGRKSMPYKTFGIHSNRNDLIKALSQENPFIFFSSEASTEKKPIVFVFSGQGSQYVNMGLGLYQTIDLFKETIDRCFDKLNKIMGESVKNILYPSDENFAEAEKNINLFLYTSPIKFIFEYSLATLLIRWGISPNYMIGHSFGEYVAACISGVLDLETALVMSSLRGRLMHDLPEGAMMSISISESKLLAFLNEDISLAAVNGDNYCIVSGPCEKIEEFQKKMTALDYECIKLRVPRAGHSRMLDPILEKYESDIRKFTFNKPQIPYISGLTGTWIKDEEAMDPAYWKKHLRDTIRFADGLKELYKKQNSIFVQLGSDKSLCNYIMNHPLRKENNLILNLIRHPKDAVSDNYFLLDKIGQLWLTGLEINWQVFNEGKGNKRISLPGYPFEKQKIETPLSGWDYQDLSLSPQSKSPLNLKRNAMSDWYYIPTWERSPVVQGETIKNFNNDIFLIFMDDWGIGIKLIEHLEASDYKTFAVYKGEKFKKIGPKTLRINPKNETDYHLLFKELKSYQMLPNKIVHMFGISDQNHEELNTSILNEALYDGFFSMIYSARVFGSKASSQNIDIFVIANGIEEVTGNENLYPEKAPILGPLKVIPQEFSNLKCDYVDIDSPVRSNFDQKKVIHQLSREIMSNTNGSIIAYRGNYRWVKSFRPIQLEKVIDLRKPFKNDGVYLVIGGTGRIGFSLIEDIAKTIKGKFVLTGIKALPPKNKWKKWIKDHDESCPVSSKINKIKRIEQLGSEVFTHRVNATDHERMMEVVNLTETSIGPINGIIHAAVVSEGKFMKFIDEIRETDCFEEFKPKINGLLVLEKIIQGRKIDFCLLISSLASLLGGLGHVAYSAANLFMDTFIYLKNRNGGVRWISINSELWNFNKTKDQPVEGPSGPSFLDYAMSLEEGIIAFRQILAADDLHHLAISSCDLIQRMKKWVQKNRRESVDTSLNQASHLLYQKPHLSNPYIAPRNKLEKDLVDIWQTIFGYQDIGINDNFFELGGDSLKAVTLLSRINNKLDVKIPIKTFFMNPTIESITQVVMYESEFNKFEGIKPTEKKDYFSLSPSQKRLYIQQMMDKKSVISNLPIILWIEGEIDKEKLEQAFLKLINRHEVLRTSIDMVDSNPIQRIHKKIVFSIDHVIAGKKDVNSLIKSFITPFQLERAPFFRIRLVEINQANYLFIMDMHHIITDGFSHSIFTNELMLAYRGVELPPLKLQYKDYSDWQNSKSHRKHLKEQERFWLDEFKGEIPEIQMPFDYFDENMEDHKGAVIEFEIDAKTCRNLNGLALEENVTLFMLLLSIYFVFLTKVSRQEDIIVGTVTANRDHADLQRILGIFVNVLAIRGLPENHKSFKIFLGEIKQKVLNAFENKEYPFDELVSHLAFERDISKNPLFDVAFAFQNYEVENDYPMRDQYPELKLINYGKNESFATSYYMTLLIEKREKSFHCKFEYRKKRFKKETMVLFIKYFKEIIEEVIKDRNQEIKNFKPFKENFVVEDKPDFSDEIDNIGFDFENQF
jgi:acyl transferase domain-containing protein/acyl carrier protein